MRRSIITPSGLAGSLLIQAACSPKRASATATFDSEPPVRHSSSCASSRRVKPLGTSRTIVSPKVSTSRGRFSLIHLSSRRILTRRHEATKYRTEGEEGEEEANGALRLIFVRSLLCVRSFVSSGCPLGVFVLVC